MNQKQIRYLCLRVFVAQGDEQYQVRLAELRTALRKPVQGAANLGIFLIMKPKTNGAGVSEPAARKCLAPTLRKSKKADRVVEIR